MKLILALVFTVYLFSGCTEKIVYIKTPCPTLPTWYVEPLTDIEYEVYDENGTN
jgi:hypothetical protein